MTIEKQPLTQEEIDAHVSRVARKNAERAVSASLFGSAGAADQLDQAVADWSEGWGEAEEEHRRLAVKAAEREAERQRAADAE